jgi:hypothetical protein
MDRSMGEVILMAVGMIAALANFVMMLRMAAAVSGLRTEIAEARRMDTEAFHEWVEARFQRRLEAPHA